MLQLSKVVATFLKWSLLGWPFKVVLRL